MVKTLHLSYLLITQLGQATAKCISVLITSSQIDVCLVSCMKLAVNICVIGGFDLFFVVKTVHLNCLVFCVLYPCSPIVTTQCSDVSKA